MQRSGPEDPGERRSGRSSGRVSIGWRIIRLEVGTPKTKTAETHYGPIADMVAVTISSGRVRSLAAPRHFCPFVFNGTADRSRASTKPAGGVHGRRLSARLLHDCRRTTVRPERLTVCAAWRCNSPDTNRSRGPRYAIVSSGDLVDAADRLRRDWDTLWDSDANLRRIDRQNRQEHSK